MKQKLSIMLQLQDSMNSKVHNNWREQNYEWYRAIWIESAELLDHYGWKWWKKQEPDNEQVILELVDIWHFGLSLLLQSGLTDDEIISQLASVLELECECGDFRQDLECFVGRTLQERVFAAPEFSRLMKGINLHFDELYRRYIGKNVLNFFRQDHGYKDGSYIKEWGGREDNEHLVELLESLDADSSSFKDDLYEGLKARYLQLTA